MSKNNVSYEEYSKDWNSHQNIFQNWRRGKSTQNINSLLRILQLEFTINVDLADQDKEYLAEANQTRNKIIHTSGHFNVSSSKYQENWNKPSPEVKITFGEYEVGELPRAVYRAIKAIDNAVVESGLLPPEVLMHSSEIESG